MLCLPQGIQLGPSAGTRAWARRGLEKESRDQGQKHDFSGIHGNGVAATTRATDEFSIYLGGVFLIPFSRLTSLPCPMFFLACRIRRGGALAVALKVLHHLGQYHVCPVLHPRVNDTIAPAQSSPQKLAATATAQHLWAPLCLDRGSSRPRPSHAGRAFWHSQTLPWK